MRLKKINEHDVQCDFFEAVRLNETQYPALSSVVAIPNQGTKGGAFWGKRRKDEGLSKGFPDIACLVPSKGYHGLFIELKVPPNKPSHEQIQWILRLRNSGYKAEILTSPLWFDAYNLLADYLGIQSPVYSDEYTHKLYDFTPKNKAKVLAFSKK